MARLAELARSTNVLSAHEISQVTHLVIESSGLSPALSRVGVSGVTYRMSRQNVDILVPARLDAVPVYPTHSHRSGEYIDIDLVLAPSHGLHVDTKPRRFA